MTKKSTKTKLTSELKSHVKTEFVQSIDLESGEKCHYTFEDLIKKYNLASATLYRAAKAENWKTLRSKFVLIVLGFILLNTFSNSLKTVGNSF